MRLVLASTSARRRSLLRDAGVAHEVVAPGIDDAELVPGSSGARHWVAALAYLKARSVAERFADALVLGADTVVCKRGRIIGQPGDERDAARIISMLAGGGHDVLTGVALLAGGTRCLFVDSASVRVGELDPEGVRAYLASGDWAGKAGAYNLRERIEAGWPITCEGDPTTVMGLPMRRLCEVLDSIGFGAGGARAGEEGA